MSIPIPLPPQFVEILIEPLNNPSGRWADYNQQYRRYLGLQKLVSLGLIPSADLPEAPSPDDYTELS